jgi:hypothetical protein
MSILNNSLLLGADAAAGGYQISRSVRFNSSDSAYLSRGFSSGSQTTWTYSAWLKRTSLATSGLNSNVILLCIPEAATQTRLQLSNNSTIGFVWSQGAAAVSTSAVFRDVSAWYHILFVWDTSNGTAADRAKFYINGSQATLSGTSISPGLTTDINSAKTHNICRLFDGGNNFYSDGYLADIHFIDGQALDPSSFGEFDTNGVWQPIDASGLTYGPNGFHLPFSDNSTAAALGTDTSSNGNTWTVNNISVTAGAGNDSVVDSPTNYGTDTGAGGEVRGNYATLNPLSLGANVALANGNLDVTLSSTNAGALGTIAMPSGKWYFEGTVGGTGNNVYIAIRNAANTQGCFYATSGLKADFSGAVAYGASSTTGDVLGVAFDNTAGTITFYKNGVSQGVAYSGISATDTWFPYWYSNVTVSTAWSFNFGQRPFAHPLSGFKALCTTNLPEPTIADGSTVMDVVTWSGDNASPRAISGLNLSPDFVWIKSRSDAAGHALFDAVRGTGNVLRSMDTSAEVANPAFGYVSGFNSDGFALTAGTYPGYESGDTNMTGRTYVAWCWDAGTSPPVSNPDGSITSQVQANASAGFSVVTWTGNASAGATIGHSLGIAPRFVIFKARSISENWNCYHGSLGASQQISLNLTGAAFATNDFNNTAPSSTLITLGSGTGNNGSGKTYVAYAFAPVAGYSAYGSYTGNGSADGPFVYTGFRPRFLMYKSSSAAEMWAILDASRPGYNAINQYLFPNSSSAEGSAVVVADFLSNGFKIRYNTADVNTPGGNYIYAAFAEHPFAYARAR